MLTKNSIPIQQKNHSFRNFRKKIIPIAYLSPTLVLMIVLLLIPIVMVIGYSLLNNVIMEKNPVFVGFENYIDILTDDVFQQALANTAYFVIVSVIVHLFIGLVFAMLLNAKINSPITRAFFRVVYILPWVFTATIIAILWRLMLYPNGIINYILLSLNLISDKVEWLSSRQLALHALTLINIWAGYPFYMVSLLAGLQGIPDELNEAATIDGANKTQLFRYITIPQLRPIIISMTMLDLIWTTQQFALVWMTTGGGPIHVTEMLSTYTYKLAFSSYKFSTASASAVIILVISILMALVYVRYQKGSDE